LVTRTNPPAGATVPVGSAVTVFVSTGPPQATVPNVVGETQNRAQTDLSNAGLQSNVQQCTTFNQNQDGRVVSQDPQANQKVSQNSTVTITVAQYAGSGGGGGTGSTTTQFAMCPGG
ncbi:MAG TPA: PASTA domain-containing protein, partial [Acidimicrobiales bacterium]|nr:PASTA domain-containing protein [Acidimicrobiales bacterium]